MFIQITPTIWSDKQIIDPLTFKVNNLEEFKESIEKVIIELNKNFKVLPSNRPRYSPKSNVFYKILKPDFSTMELNYKMIEDLPKGLRGDKFMAFMNFT